MPYAFTAPLQLSDNEVWYFVAVPPDMADEIDERTAGLQGGFGSVKVEVTVGATTWSTSLFPSKGIGSYWLPMKKQVRVAEDLHPDDAVDVTLRIAGLE